MKIPRFWYGGKYRYLGVLPPEQVTGLPEFRLHYEVASQDRIEPMRLTDVQPIEDQGGSSACGGFAGEHCVVNLHAQRTGGEVLKLSGTYLYSKANGGQDNGSVLSKIIEAAKQYGCCPLEYFPESCLFVGQGSPQADQMAARFKLEEAYTLRSAMEICTALAIHRQPVLLGLQIPNPARFAAPDAEGVSAPPGMGNPVAGGHALMADELYYSTHWGWCVGGPNQWGLQAGVRGRYRVPFQGYLTTNVNAFALKGLVPDPSSDGPAAVA